jgi:hypothetical protein
MPTRKVPVSLARTAGPEQHDAHVWARIEYAKARVLAARLGAPLVEAATQARREVAQSAVETFQRGVSSLGFRLPHGMTPDRLLRADGRARVETATDRVVTYDEHNQPTVKRVPVVRTRVTDATVEILAARRLLSKDPDKNKAYLKAARRIHEDWTAAGLSAIGSIDFDRDGAKGTEPRLFRSEAQVDAFSDYFFAMASLTPDERSIVHAIVIEELPVPLAGQKMLEYRGTKQAQAAAISLLRNALYRLDRHYEQVSRDRDDDARRRIETMLPLTKCTEYEPE